MAIRANYSGDQGLQRKIDRAYEMAALARQDGDRADETRWMDEVRRLGELLDKEPTRVK